MRIRAWQQDCAAAINQLSGGSKAHWLARAYSGAFLVRSARGGVVVEVDATEIVDRILGVLAQGAASLSRMDDVAAFVRRRAAAAPIRIRAQRGASARPRADVRGQPRRPRARRVRSGADSLVRRPRSGAHRCSRPRATAGSRRTRRTHCRLVLREAHRRGRKRGTHSRRLRPPAARGAEVPGSDRCRWRAAGGRAGVRARGPTRRSGAPASSCEISIPADRRRAETPLGRSVSLPFRGLRRRGASPDSSDPVPTPGRTARRKSANIRPEAREVCHAVDAREESDQGRSESEGREVGVPFRRRKGRRQREDARAARRQGRRARGDDERGPPRPSRVHHHHRGLQRVLQGRPEAAAGTLGSGGARPRGGRTIHEEAPRRPEGPAARLRALGCGDVDARDDGHGPQSRPQRREPPGPRDAHEERALRVGRVPQVHLDVRPDRPRYPRREVRRGAREAQAREGREVGHRTRREGPRRAGRRVQGHRQEGDRKAVSDRAARPAPPRGRGRLRLVVRARARRTTGNSSRSRTTSARRAAS